MTDVLSPSQLWPRNTMSKTSKQARNPKKSTRKKIPQLTNDISSRKPSRTITLYRNGDRYFPGKQISIKPDNYNNLQLLFNELSNIVDLPYGVRHLFTPDNGLEITDVSFLRDGASYVCGSFEPFQKLAYTTISLPRVTFNNKQLRQPLNDLHASNRTSVRHLPSTQFPKVGVLNAHSITSNATTTNRFLANNLFLQSFTSAAANSIQQQKKTNFRQSRYGVESFHHKPRSITIVKQGNERPHKTITILLNRRTVQTYDQLLSDISEAFGYQKSRTDKIKRLFTLKGRQVNGINDFFRDDDVFIAVTNSTDISSGDLHEINLRMGNDSRHSTTHRNPSKKPVQVSIDHDVSSTAPSMIETKKPTNIRDSGLVEDDDGLSARNIELTSTRPTNSGNTPASNDLGSRKLKKTHKLTTISNIEQQRERERQRLRDEEEQRRKRILSKKEHQQGIITFYSIPKFEQLAIDTKNSPIISRSDRHSNDDEIIPISIKFTPKTRSLIIHSSPSIVTDKYDLGKKMGDGNFAVVRRSKLRDGDREVAIKIIDKAKMKGKHYMLEHEINIMYLCNHSNIIHLFEDYETADEIYLVMELIKGGDLFDYITKHRCFDEPTAALMIKDVSEALLYLHTKKIVHRDVKPENLLVMQKKDGRITIKLTDFGLAMQVTGPIKTVCGTPTYVAPEILAETGYGVEVDCWATGIILYILLCGYPPFKTAERNQEELFQMIQRGKFSYDTEYWSTISLTAKNLIDHLLVVDRQKRMCSLDILLHPWILHIGQSKSIRNTEELKSTLRLQYDIKIKEYALENTAN